MKQFLNQVSPKGALGDLLDVWRISNPHRWPVLGISMALTFALFMLFVPGDGKVLPKPPEITWITTFDESRTAADIIASNCANQELKEALEARLAARAELRRDMYKALGRATYIDVDQIEREAEAERAAEEAAAAAARPTNLPREASMSVEEYCAMATNGAATGVSTNR